MKRVSQFVRSIWLTLIFSLYELSMSNLALPSVSRLVLLLLLILFLIFLYPIHAPPPYSHIPSCSFGFALPYLPLTYLPHFHYSPHLHGYTYSHSRPPLTPTPTATPTIPSLPPLLTFRGKASEGIDFRNNKGRVVIVTGEWGRLFYASLLRDLTR